MYCLIETSIVEFSSRVSSRGHSVAGRVTTSSLHAKIRDGRTVSALVVAAACVLGPERVRSEELQGGAKL